MSFWRYSTVTVLPLLILVPKQRFNFILKEALPQKDRYLVAYHRLRMTAEYAINPFDTQLVVVIPPRKSVIFSNFITLLTPLARNGHTMVYQYGGFNIDEIYTYLLIVESRILYQRY